MSTDAPLQQLLLDHWVKGSTWDGFLRYAQKNVQGFHKVYEDSALPDDLVGWAGRLKTEIRLLVIGADWCGDVVANIPALARLSEINPAIQLRIVDRDRHEELMNRFLTNGGKAIPIVIIGRADFSEIRHWGPRPAACQAIMNENKGKVPKEQIFPLIRDWYAQDRHRSLYREIADAIKAVSGSD